MKKSYVSQGDLIDQQNIIFALPKHSALMSKIVLLKNNLEKEFSESDRDYRALLLTVEDIDLDSIKYLEGRKSLIEKYERRIGILERLYPALAENRHIWEKCIKS